MEKIRLRNLFERHKRILAIVLIACLTVGLFQGYRSVSAGVTDVNGSTITADVPSVTAQPTEEAQQIQDVQEEMVMSATTTKTIYFDTVGNGGWNGWTKDCDMYIYLMDVSDDIRPMTKSSKTNTLVSDSTGTLWEYTISESDLSKCTGIIFINSSTWGDGTNQTVDIAMSVFADDAYPCFQLDGGNSGSKKTYSYLGSLQPKSYAGSVMYLYDMTGSISTPGARFTGDGAANVYMNMTAVQGTENLYQVTVPKDEADMVYTTVEFCKNSDTGIVSPYNYTISSSVYTPAKNNTYYYGAAEIDGTLYGTWGEQNADSGALKSKQLYFDSLHFPTTEDVTIQLGNDTAEKLVQFGSAYTYTVPETSTATQQTIITVTKGTEKYRFFWEDITKNLVTMKDSFAVVSKVYGGNTGDKTVYYDATLSKLHYETSGITPNGSNGAGDYGIPNNSGTICYYATGSGKPDLKGNMEKVDTYKKGNNAFSDVYSVDLPEGYTNIVFSSFEMKNATNYGGHGESTDTLTIPNTLSNPCFYGDTSDNVIYDGGKRAGYWAEVYTVRNPELRGSESKTIVDIPTGTEVRQNNKLYVNTTYYDFYTDYELNGNNRDNYTYDANNHRIYQPFRQFDQALSDYYTACKASSPLYWGNFQNYPGSPYREIAWDLKLFGYDTSNNASDLSHKFFYENNSMWGRNGNEIKNVGKNATQGLASSSLSNGNLMIKTSSGTVAAPYLNESFLAGNNSKNTVLGKVYHNVSFPFTKKSMGSNSKTGLTGQADYWVFDSKDKTTNLRMKKDTATGSYFLEESGDVVLGKTTAGPTSVGNFFPFNSSAQGGNAGKLNYGFAMKLEVNFRLTEDGNIINSAGEVAPIEFNFSGDDDIWIFVDGNLALDIGGGHGEVSGYLNFADRKAYVSHVKDASASSGWTSKTNEFTIKGENTGQHTLTMFYMERGIWESNMYVSFNFPDENNLEVQKKVDDSAVNQELFGGVFEQSPMFPFTIKTQATHYGAKEVSSDNKVEPIVFNSTFSTEKISKASADNTFERTSTWQGRESVVHYLAKYSDANGTYKNKRTGIVSPESGETADVSKVKDYLSFVYYYDADGFPALNHTYIELEDASGNKIGSYLNGKTYGTASMKGKEWSKLTIDLSKFSGYGTFDFSKLKNVKFAYNYEEDFYLDEITFMAKSTVSQTQGFVTNQRDIPDYGSVASGKLEYPEGAVYIVKSGSDATEYQRIGSDGKFVLANGETAVFHEQFRRGSYISIEEEVDANVFETTYTVYENGVPVTSMKDGSTIDFTANATKNLSNVSGTAIDDGRIEVCMEDPDDKEYKNKGYTETKKPEGNTIVYRSFANPDMLTGSTKVEITYINKVKTGSLTLKKVQAEDSENLEGEYTFNITFTNIAGMGLEGEKTITKTVTLKVGESETISGIPINTGYKIMEVTPEDGSTLDHISEAGNYPFLLDSDTKMVSGRITAEAVKHEYTFTNIKNTEKPVTNVKVIKDWKDSAGNTLTENIKSSIKVKLQRKAKGSTSVYEDVAVNGMNHATIEPGYTNNWTYVFENLDRYVDYKSSPQVEWEYRVVELNAEGNVVEEGNYADGYKVSYTLKAVGNETNDTECTITNTYQSTNIKIVKTDATDNTIKLSDVEFTLEKLNSEGKVDTSFTSLNKITDSEGIILFTGLENGTYRITETKAKEGYNLLKQPITVVINRDGESTVDEKVCTIEDDTITVNVSNKQKFQMPFTGGYGRTIFMILGICFIVAAVVVYYMRKRNKTIVF